MIDIKELAKNTSSLKILYVEDDEALREETLELFSHFFDRITTASNGEEGLAHYREKPFDIVISDIHMPVMDGIEMLKQIKKIQADQAAIVISAHDDSKYLFEMINLGIDHFILKPLDLQNFLEIIHRVYHNLIQYRVLLRKMEQDSRSLELMEQGIFRFRTIENINTLASMLSNICPKPTLVLQGLMELLINAVEHGNLGVTYDEKTNLLKNRSFIQEIEKRLQMPEHQGKYGKIEFYRNSDEVQFIITDEGPGFDFKKYLKFDEARIFDNHGRGIAMSNSQYFDQLEYLGPGNQVKTIVKLH